MSGRRLAALSAAELLAIPAPDPGFPAPWGGWLADFGNGVLRHAAEDYEIDLDAMLTAAAVLDWLMQVAGKMWTTPGVLAGLVRLVDRVTAPQATVCRGYTLPAGWWRPEPAREAEARSWN